MERVCHWSVTLIDGFSPFSPIWQTMQSAPRQRAIFLLLAAVNVACSVDVHVLDGDIQQLLRMEAALLKQQGRHDSEVALFQPLQNIAGINNSCLNRNYGSFVSSSICL